MQYHAIVNIPLDSARHRNLTEDEKAAVIRAAARALTSNRTFEEALKLEGFPSGYDFIIERNGIPSGYVKP